MNKYQPRLIPASLQISEIECRCFTWKVPRSRMLAGLIEFAGTYRPGSAGTNDARMIKWRVSEMWEHPKIISGLIVDFRQLDYVWGDDLYIPRANIVSKPLRVVVAPASYEAYSGVIQTSLLLTDIQVAFAEVKDALAHPK